MVHSERTCVQPAASATTIEAMFWSSESWAGRGRTGWHTAVDGDYDGPTAALAQGVLVVWGSSLVRGMGAPMVVL